MQIKLIYEPDSWKKEFSKRASQLQNLFTDNLHSIHHVGSTSIPAMWSKNTVDIIAVVKELNKSVINAVKELKYSYLGECFVPASAFFDIKDKDNESNLNIHLRVVEQNHGSIALNLCFKKTLSENPALHSRYLELKKQLAQDPEANEKISIPNSKVLVRKYTFLKNAFIKKALKMGGYNGVQLSYIVQSEEIEVYKKLLEAKTFASRISMHQHINPVLHNKEINNKEIIIYHGTEIIGYCIFAEHITIHTIYEITPELLNKIQEQIELYIDFHHNTIT